MKVRLPTTLKVAYSLTMISKLYSLLFETKPSYEENLATLLDLVAKCEENSLIVASEVCLTGYDWENFETMLAFASQALPKLLQATQNKTLIFTILERDGDGAKNYAYVMHNGKIIHRQAKAKLFKFGDEHHYLDAGDESDIVLFELDGIKLGVLICFELRFKSLWQQLEGADIIAVPSWWGILREQNYKILTTALAIMNQCYVVCSDAQNAECTRASGVITPFGKEFRNEGEKILSLDFSKKEIQKMRRYMDVGIK